MKILLTGARAPATLELARSFYEAGHVVYAADSISGHLCESSRYIHANFLLPPPRQQSAEFISKLRAVILENGIDLLVPTCEETFYVSMGRDQLPCRVFVESIEKLKLAHDKWEFYLLSRKLGLAVPETQRVSTPGRLADLGSKWSGLVLKPLYSRFGSATMIRPTLLEAAGALRADPDRAWIAQEFIPGQQICSYSVAHSGRLSAHTAYRSTFTAGVGATILFKHIEHPPVQLWVEKLVRELDWTGQIAFDFIERGNGEVVALECNPRATSGVHVFSGDPRFAACFLSAGAGRATPRQRKPAMLLTGMLIYGLPAALRSRRLAEWVRAILGGRDVVFRSDDPLPFLLQIRGILLFTILGLKRRISPLAASTFDIEWNGAERA